MVVSMKRALVMVILALVLLAGLIGWTMRVQASPSLPFHTGMHSSHVLAVTCPPPPRNC